ncbi:hypothetical protein HYW75_05500 [Candidatus Pacearchaeota archaeon]|nr:hypothetical protein [Candidatus Pacearchaeota archaeon]
MAKRVEKKENLQKKQSDKIKEIKSKIKEIKVLESEKKPKEEESLLEKEIEEKDQIFSPPPSSAPLSETPITLRPDTTPQQLEEVLPFEQTQFQKEDQRNFSQSISYSQQNTYQQPSGQRTYQSSAASASQQTTQHQENLMRSAEGSMDQRPMQRLISLVPSNGPIVKMNNEIERPHLQRENQEQESRYSYKEKTLPEVNKRRRDMF